MSALILLLALLASGLDVACSSAAGNVLTVSPDTVTVAPGASRQFTALLAGVPYSMVTWQVNGAEGGNGVVGTVSAGGLYTAPAAQPLPPVVLVTATAQTGGAPSEPATITLSGGTPLFSNASLQGAYVFRSLNYDISNPAAIAALSAAGRFVADGNGHLSSGSSDVNNAVTGEQSTETFTGTYTVGQDGRGVMTWTVPQGEVMQDFVLRSDGSADLLTASTTEVGSGTFLPQPPAALNGATVAGTYALDLVGTSTIDNTTGPMAASGVLTLDANGSLSGQADVNNQGAVAQAAALSGSYSFSGVPGRMLVTLQAGSLGTLHFAVDVASAERALWVETDSKTPSLAGESVRQTGGPFSNASLAGIQVFQLLGTSATRLVGRAGQFEASASGAIVTGLYDENDTGSLLSSASISGGVFQVSPDGRFTATLDTGAGGAIALAGVLVSPQQGFLTGVDTTIVNRGQFYRQAAPGPSGAFSVADLKGTLAGVLNGATGTGPEFLLLASSADGAGGWGGTADANQFGTLIAAQPLAGTYSLAGNGRGLLSLPWQGTVRHFAFYFAGGNRLAIVNQDSAELLAGSLDSQF